MSYLSQVMLDTPSGYWPLNETSGTTAFDLSGNGRNGTYTGSCTLASRVVRPGPLAPDFTGGYVSLGDLTAWETEAGASGKFSIEGWFVADSGYASNPMIFTKGGTSNFEWSVLLGTGSDELNFYVYQSNFTTVHRLQVTGLVLTARLHSFMASFDHAASGSLYIDGDIVATSVGFIGNATAGTAEARIGSRVNGGIAFDGGLSDLSYYSTALSAGRAKAHYQAGLRDAVVV